MAENVKFVGKTPTNRTFTRTAGAAITAGTLVVRAGDDDKYDPVADNGTKISGLAISKASADGDSFAMIGLAPGDRIEMPYTGSFSAGMTGSRFGVSNAYTVDLADTTNDVVQLDVIDSPSTGRGIFIVVGGEYGGQEI